MNKKIEDDLNFHYQMTKGRLAETLIEEMLIHSDYEVHRYGMENMIPGLVRRLRKHNSYASNHVKRMPDFVVKKDNDDIHFVEVKFTASGYFDITDLNRNGEYPYDECLFIIVSKESFKALTVSEMKGKSKITPMCGNHLQTRPEFELSEEIVKHYLKMVKIFFENVPSKYPL